MSRVVEAPPCRACGLTTTTPLRDLPSGWTTDRYHPLAPEDDGHATVWCGACGKGWIAAPAELAQATRALRWHYDQSGHDAGPETDIERAYPPQNPAQLALPLGGES